MRIRVVHETIYTYEQPARGLVQVLRLTPRDHDGQYVRTWRIDTTIDGRLTAREDGFGNVVHWFTPDEPADALTIRVTGEVDTDDTNGVVRGTVERLPDQFFLRDTDLCAASPELHAFAERVAAEGDGAVLALLHRLMGAVRGAVTYEPGPASSAVPAAKAFAAGSGVCQDLAHVFLAAARHIGIPARYVAGYRARDGRAGGCRGAPWLGRGPGAGSRLGGVRSVLRRQPLGQLHPRRNGPGLSRRGPDPWQPHGGWHRNTGREAPGRARQDRRPILIVQTPVRRP